MGKVNNVMHHYMRNKGRFADLFNGVFFHGKKVFSAENLSDASEQYSESEKNDDKQSKRLARTRDIKMKIHSSGEVLRLLALENQNLTDYSMPFRCMQYDVMEYQKQLDELKQKNKETKACSTAAEKLCGVRKADRLIPVHTLCLYHGEEEWDGPRSLKDMMAFGKNDEMESFFADYPLRLFCVNEETDFNVFHTELKEVFEALKYRRNKKELRRVMTEKQGYSHLSEDTVEVLSVLLDAPDMWENRNLYMNRESEQEEYDMCQAMREMLRDEREAGQEEGREKGREEGRKEGQEEGRIELILKMLKNGITCEEVSRMTEEPLEKIERIANSLAAV